MDPSILELFTADEVLQRAGDRELTGLFKISTASESAEIYFDKGVVVAAIKESYGGEETLRQVLQWKEAKYSWQPDAVPPKTLQPLQIKIVDFLKKEMPSINPIWKLAPRTGGIAQTKHVNGAGNTATRSFTATGETRVQTDEELLKQHRFTLILVSDPDQRYKITRVNSLVGRNPTCNISIPDSSISRQHCLLQITGEGLLMKDLNSVNGTKINGAPMKEGYLSDGDKLTVGHVRLTVEAA